MVVNTAAPELMAEPKAVGGVGLASLRSEGKIRGEPVLDPSLSGLRLLASTLKDEGHAVGGGCRQTHQPYRHAGPQDDVNLGHPNSIAGLDLVAGGDQGLGVDPDGPNAARITRRDWLQDGVPKFLEVRWWSPS